LRQPRFFITFTCSSYNPFYDSTKNILHHGYFASFEWLGRLRANRGEQRLSGNLVSFTDTITDESGYKNQNGDIVIPSGKYIGCFTDTFRTYAIVVKPNSGFVAIDWQEKILYEVFPFDNGPDEPSDGLFRILFLSLGHPNPTF